MFVHNIHMILYVIYIGTCIFMTDILYDIHIDFRATVCNHVLFSGSRCALLAHLLSYMAAS